MRSFLCFVIALLWKVVSAVQVFNEINISEEQGIILKQNEISFFEFENINNEEYIEFQVSLQLNAEEKARYANRSFLLMGSLKPIQSNEFEKNLITANRTVESYLNNTMVFDADIDGLGTMKKDLIIRFIQKKIDGPIPSKWIYFYILGSYKFGDEQPTLIPDSPSPSELMINAKYSLRNKITCQNDCFQNQNQGSCIQYEQNYSYCECQAGYLSQDCGVTGVELKIDEDVREMNIKAGERVRFYVDFSNKDNQVETDVYFSMSIQSQQIQLPYFISSQTDGGTKWQVPDYYYWQNMQGYQFSQTQVSNLEKVFKVSYSLVAQLEYYEARYIVMVVGQNQDTTLSIQFTLGGIDTTPLILFLYILIVLIGLFIVIYAIYSLCFAKKRRQEAERRREAAVNSNNVEMINVRAAAGNSKILSLEDIEKFMPKKKFDKSQMNGDACAVCLEDFMDQTDSVRMTICSHFFHDDCLQQWLKKQQNCPFCRQELSLKKLEEFKENPIQYQFHSAVQVKQNIKHEQSHLEVIPNVDLSAAQGLNQENHL